VLDQLTSNTMLPIDGLIIAIFVGWVLPATVLKAELSMTGKATRLLRFFLRDIVPAIIALIVSSSFWRSQDPLPPKDDPAD
jgi:NSS family neurotransmitter:Na+ symporter